MLGITSSEFLVILFVALLVLGPDGLRTVMRGFRSCVDWFTSMSARLRNSSDLTGVSAELSEARTEMSGLASLNKKNIDLSEYNPTEIIRQAVREETQAWIRQLEGREK